MSNWVYGVMWFACLIPAIVCHEVAHGYAADKLGDPTAKMLGRLSLNPIKHIDPVGTIILPAFMLLMSQGQSAFGWAKPVPINPRNFKNHRHGMLITGLAGPAVNLAFVLLGAAIYWAIILGTWVVGGVTDSVANVLDYFLTFAYVFSQANVVLLFLNLIPIPPLDGSRVLPLFLSDKALAAYHSFERYGLMIFFVVVVLLPQQTGFDPLGMYFNVTAWPILDFLFQLQG